MPLIKSNSKKAKKQNFLELVTGVVGGVRHKAIKKIMRRRKISYEKARQIQAAAITKYGRGS